MFKNISPSPHIPDSSSKVDPKSVSYAFQGARQAPRGISRAATEGRKNICTEFPTSSADPALLKYERIAAENGKKVGVISLVQEPTAMVCTDGGRSKAKQCSENMLRFHRTQSLHTPRVDLGTSSGGKIRFEARCKLRLLAGTTKRRQRAAHNFNIAVWAFLLQPAPEHFQKELSSILQGASGVVCHMNDVLL